MGCSFLELFEPRHIRSMQHRRVCIVSLLKLLCFVLEMLLNECDLIRCTRILRDHSHHPSRLSHLEYMYRFRHIKWHYAMRHLVYVLLPRLSKHNRQAPIRSQLN